MLSSGDRNLFSSEIHLGAVPCCLLSPSTLTFNVGLFVIDILLLLGWSFMLFPHAVVSARLLGSLSSVQPSTSSPLDFGVPPQAGLSHCFSMNTCFVDLWHAHHPSTHHLRHTNRLLTVVKTSVKHKEYRCNFPQCPARFKSFTKSDLVHHTGMHLHLK